MTEETKLPKGFKSWISMAILDKDANYKDIVKFGIPISPSEPMEVVTYKVAYVRSQAFLELINSEELMSDNELYRIMNILKGELEPNNPLAEKIERILENRHKKQMHF
jgi:hypothetical protein